VELLLLPEVTPSPLHTLWKGLERIEHRWPAFFMHPVDFPFVRSRTLHAMASAFRPGTAKIVQPRYGNRGGHPVLIHMSLAKEIKLASPEKGLREVVRRDPDRVRRLSVEDPGVVKGINCPSDLESEPPPSGNQSR
jgi:CTP:molybdopterin cytidylyltransferase MocA